VKHLCVNNGPPWLICRLSVIPQPGIAAGATDPLAPGVKAEMAKQGIAVQSTFDAGQLTGFILEVPNL
jgi:hypothetical protein